MEAGMNHQSSVRPSTPALDRRIRTAHGRPWRFADSGRISRFCVLTVATGNGPPGTKGFAGAARLHSHEELTELRFEPARAEAGGGAAWMVAARPGCRSVTSPN